MHNAELRIRESFDIEGSDRASRGELGRRCRYWPGGTDLISLMKDYVETPRRVVNIKNIKELGGISSRKVACAIGAVVTFEESDEESRRPDSSSRRSVRAVRGVSSPQIRNMGTVGGDLCQRPRCWYFRPGTACLP